MFHINSIRWVCRKHIRIDLLSYVFVVARSSNISPALSTFGKSCNVTITFSYFSQTSEVSNRKKITFSISTCIRWDVVYRSLLTFTWVVSMRMRKVCVLTMIKVEGGDFTGAFLSFLSFVVLEPIEHVHALDLTVKLISIQ